jgi:hypothetical protein
MNNLQRNHQLQGLDKKKGASPKGLRHFLPYILSIPIPKGYETYQHGTYQQGTYQRGTGALLSPTCRRNCIRKASASKAKITKGSGPAVRRGRENTTLE